MNGHNGQSVAEVYQDFIFAKTAEGVSDITIRNYHQHLHNISKYLDIEMSMEILRGNTAQTNRHTRPVSYSRIWGSKKL